MYWIYVIKNQINDHIYVGFTRNIDDRMKQHRLLRSGCSHLVNAIKKYGIENFFVEIIEFGRDEKHGLTVRESCWIQQLHPEYNITAGGEGILNYTHSLETRAKISHSLKKRVVSQNTRRKISLALTGKKRGPLSSQRKHLISTTQKNRIHSREHNAKISYTLSRCYVILSPTGEVLHVRGLARWAKQNGVSAGNLSNRGHSKGYTILQHHKAM